MSTAYNVIPGMTHRLSVHWKQPPLDAILLDGKHAVMSQATLDALREYSASIPTGVYEGKMWKCAYYDDDENKGWMLRWYADPIGDEMCIYSRKVLVV